MAHVLRMRVDSQFTAACLLHRFLDADREAIKQQTPSVWIGACLFVATKVSEDPRRLRDVVNGAHMLHIDDGQVQWKDHPPALDDTYLKRKRQMIQAEHDFLKVVAFDTSVAPAHRALVLSWRTTPADSRKQAQAFRWLHQTVYRVEILRFPVLDIAAAVLVRVLGPDVTLPSTVARDRVSEILTLLPDTPQGLSSKETTFCKL